MVIQDMYFEKLIQADQPAECLLTVLLGPRNKVLHFAVLMYVRGLFLQWITEAHLRREQQLLEKYFVEKCSIKANIYIKGAFYFSSKIFINSSH